MAGKWAFQGMLPQRVLVAQQEESDNETFNKAASSHEYVNPYAAMYFYIAGDVTLGRITIDGPQIYQR